MKNSANKSAAGAAFPSTRHSAPARSLAAARTRMAASSAETRAASEKRLKAVAPPPARTSPKHAQKKRARVKVGAKSAVSVTGGAGAVQPRAKQSEKVAKLPKLAKLPKTVQTVKVVKVAAVKTVKGAPSPTVPAKRPRAATKPTKSAPARETAATVRSERAEAQRPALREGARESAPTAVVGVAQASVS
jgi:hypothetical protein